MSIRTILVPVNGTESDSLVLDGAFTVAQRFDGHIDVLHALMDPRDAVPFLGEGASGALIQQIMEAAQRDAGGRATRARAAFDAWRQRCGIALTEAPSSTPGPTAAWREELGPEDEIIARRGRLTDLIIVAQPAADATVTPTISFEAALLDTGRPVLAVPRVNGKLTHLDEAPAVIAWNGSVEAGRAISAALPFLASASRVAVLAVVEGGKAADVRGILNYLDWHGVHAEAAEPLNKANSVGAQILAETDQLQAGLLVMGAYTRSRLRRLVFGGVTEHVLTNAMLPVLMAH